MQPFAMVYAFLFFLFWSSDRNVIKHEKIALQGFKNNAICKSFDVQTLKAIGRSYNNSTINDVVLALCSVSLREYMRN